MAAASATGEGELREDSKSVVGSLQSRVPARTLDRKSSVSVRLSVLIPTVSIASDCARCRRKFG